MGSTWGLGTPPYGGLPFRPSSQASAGNTIGNRTTFWIIAASLILACPVATAAAFVTPPRASPHAALRTVAEGIDNDEDFAVEFKSTARRDLREDKPNKLVEDVVKTVAGFLNTDGGTLLIGVGPDHQMVGLSYDYQRVKPSNGDGFVNWLTTHLTNALGHAAVMRTRARITVHEGHELCRLDVARSSRPVWARTSKEDRVFLVRMNNSTRVLPEQAMAAYLEDRWGSREGSGAGAVAAR